ncbi:MAG: ATP-binding cassette domain-containing protein [Rikenellaceae bacterium]|nr:ATP-binding cassette domain-containing protein [Rikenellaceae bacterium]
MITIDHLSKSYGHTKVLDEVCFNIPPQSIFGFLGPNGAGKTTLIRILTGILMPDQGEIRIDNESFSKLDSSRIGYLPEERGLYKKMKVRKQAVYFAVLRGLTRQEAEKRVKQWFEKLNISDWWDKKADTLSKGMQQKIQFIISAIHQPDVLILDEPFSGLDPINRDVLGKEIIELNQAGTTILLSTHDMNSVEQFCDHVVLMDKGHILLAGKVNEIKQARKTFLYEFCFKQNDELFLNQCLHLHAKPISIDKDDTGIRVRVQFPHEIEIEILLTNILGKIGLTSFREILPSMHDIFLGSITGRDI